MKKHLSYIIIASLVFLSSCEKQDTGVDNINNVQNFGFGRESLSTKVDQSQAYIDIPFFKTIATEENQTINFQINNSATINGIANDNSFSNSDFINLPTSVTIPAGSKVAYARINFNHSNLAYSEKIINFILTNPTETNNISRRTFKLKYKALCTLNEVSFNVTQDRYGSETTWKIFDSNGSVVWSGGPYTDLSSNTTLVLPTQINCLPNGNYTLKVYDAYGDGMVTSSSVYGKYELKKSDGTTLVSGLGNAFTTVATHTFSLP